MSQKYKFETLQLHAGQETTDPTGSRAVPIYQTSAYVFKSSQQARERFALTDAGNIYGRLTNPTQEIFEQRMAALEGGTAALAVASGAAAVTYVIQAIAHAGDHIVASKNVYGGTYNLLSHTLRDAGITASFIETDDYDGFEQAIQPNTKAIFAETLSNPNSVPADIERLAEIAHSHSIPLIIDNTFATPFLLRPLEHGADIVVHSASKFIGGHGTAIGGVIVDGGFDWEKSGKFPSLAEPDPSYHGINFSGAAGKAALVTKIRAVLLRDTGATLAPLHAFLFLQGLETLSLRVERHTENALRVVEYLQKNPKVRSVNHPAVKTHPQHLVYNKYFPRDAGSVFSFDINGSEKDALAFIDRLKIFSIVANVADAKSLVIHPATTTHSQLTDDELAEQGISPSTIRLSIGLEHIDDIIADLEQAFTP